MTFDEKLNFLMDITKTSNSTLAHSVKLDASYISRLRSGKRLMPKDKLIIRGMAACLARRFKEDDQKKVLSDKLKLVNLPSDSSLIADEVACWLFDIEENSSNQVVRFLSGLSRIAGRQDVASAHSGGNTTFPDESVSIYYGIEGKRRAAESFLSEVAAQENPQHCFFSAMRKPLG